jgi:predicted dehydrogenase
MFNRREFLKQSGRLAATTALINVPLGLSASAVKNSAASVRVGLIGCKGMGWNNLKSFMKNPDVSVEALCDIDENILTQRKSELQQQGINVTGYTDHRKLLENKNIDVVIIATPDHWHCLQLLDACAAGKDIYVEKPLANSIGEVTKMVNAVAASKRIVQANQWQRSQAHFKDAVNYLHEGKLGKIVLVKTWMHRSNSVALPPVADEPVPSGVDYDRWLGPAEKRPFNKNRFHYEFRWYWDYAGGLMTDWGVHLLDIALWGMKARLPMSVVSSGGKYVFDDARETPDTQNVLYNYGAFDITWEHTLVGGRGYFNQNHGLAFIGQNGTLILSRRGWEVVPEKDLIAAVPWTPSSDNGLDLHVTNFLDAVRTRDATRLNCPVAAAGLAAEVSHMGNIAFRTGDKINWNDQKRSFDSKKANEFVTARYHNGYKLS